MTAGHPTIEAIADYRDGLLAAGQQASVAAHVRRCADCRAALQAVGEVSTILAAASADVAPMPTHVATRLDEALCQAVADRDGADRAGTVVPLEGRSLVATPRARHRSRPLLLAAAVAAAVIGGVAIAELDLSTGGSADSSTAQRAAVDANGPGGDADAELEEQKGAPGAAAPFGLHRLSPQTLPQYAEGLAGATQRVTPVADRCAAAPEQGGDVVSGVRWKGAPAIVVVDRAGRQATVLDCETASKVLFRTGY